MDPNHQQKLELYRRLCWDYQLSTEEFALLISGQKDHVGHYTKKELFKKVLESYSWFTVLRLFTPEQVLDLLTDDLIKNLRMPQMRQQYAFIKKRLQEYLQVSG